MTTLKALLLWLSTSVHAPTGAVPCADLPSGDDARTVTVDGAHSDAADTDATGSGDRGRTHDSAASRARTGDDDGIYNGF